MAKATDKSTKDEAKTTKTAKAIKTEPVKEENAPKAKAVKEEVPEKETKATKTTAKANSDETVIVEGEGKTHGKYVIKRRTKATSCSSSTLPISESWQSAHKLIPLSVRQRSVFKASSTTQKKHLSKTKP